MTPPELVNVREWQARAAKVPAVGRASVGFWSVLRAVADRADFETGRNARPSWDTIQTAAKVSRAVVGRALPVAVELGLLVVEKEAHRRPTTYRLGWPSALSLQSLGLQVQQRIQSLRETQEPDGDSNPRMETQLSLRAETPPIRKPEEREAAAASLPSALEEKRKTDQEVVALRLRVRELEAENARLRAAQAPEAPSRPAVGRQEESRKDMETPAISVAATEMAVSPTRQDPVDSLLAQFGDRVTDANRETAQAAARVAIDRRDASPDRRLAAVAALLEKSAGKFDPARLVGALVRPADQGGMSDDEVKTRAERARNGPAKPKALSAEDIALLEARREVGNRLFGLGLGKAALVIRAENDAARRNLACSPAMRALGSDRQAIMADLEARHPELFPKAESPAPRTFEEGPGPLDRFLAGKRFTSKGPIPQVGDLVNDLLVKRPAPGAALRVLEREVG